MKRISDRELDIMKIFWEKNEPLIASEIATLNPAIGISTIQLVLKKLLKKEYIKIAEIVYSGKVLTRKYEVIKQPEDFFMSEMKHAFFSGTNRKGISSAMISALLSKEDFTEKELDELDMIITEHRRELNKEK